MVVVVVVVIVVVAVVVVVVVVVVIIYYYYDNDDIIIIIKCISLTDNVASKKIVWTVVYCLYEAQNKGNLKTKTRECINNLLNRVQFGYYFNNSSKVDSETTV